MTVTKELRTELDRVERTACALNDAASQAALRRYAREIEYDVVYCVQRRQSLVTI